VLEAEAVHPDGAPALHEPAKVAEVVAVAAVADDHAPEVDASWAKIACCAPRSSAAQVWVEIGPRSPSGPRGGAQDVLDDRGHAGGVVAHLMMAALTPVARSPAEYADEERGHLVDPWPLK